MKPSWILTGSLLAAVAVMPIAAAADDHRDDHRKSQYHRDAFRDARDHNQHEREQRLRREREERAERERRERHAQAQHNWRDRDRDRDHDRDADRHRSGWDKGRKKGWHGDDLPPGQAKKG